MNRRAKTENGWVVGLPGSDTRITSFKGIPFAAPPVGKNRWRKPQPCANWEGDLQAYTFGPIGMHDKGKPGRDNIWSREWAVDYEIPMSEDCLYLNIWAPADGYPVGVGDQYRETEDTPLPEPGNMPVYVWFFGGGFQVGHTTEMEFDGERLARRGIVVVTVNYRLNVFGFLSHPELTKEAPDAPTNFAFLDQQYGLQWVKRNISAFGGNPDNITIGGQSAGGMSVCAHLANPDNEGLFQKAIIESGIFFPAYSNQNPFGIDLHTAEQRGVEFFEKLGVKTLEEARKIEADVLLKKMMELPPMFFTVVSDRAYCKYMVNEWFLEPGHIKCPLFMSYTNNEMMLRPGAKNPEELRALGEELNGVDAESFVRAFSGADNEEDIGAAGEISGTDLAVHTILRYTKEETPIWVARFSAEIPGWDHPGAFHSSDLWFYFENFAKCWRPFNGKHYELARQMCDYWANFIRNGDPNGKGTDWKMLPEWPRLTSKNPVRMEFDDHAHAVDDTPSPVQQVLTDGWLKAHQE